MKWAAMAMGLALLAGECAAEPGQIDKGPLSALYSAHLAPKDGTWLKWACGEYLALFKTPGTLWKKTDTPREHLGAGLCAGFVAGVLGGPGGDACRARREFDPRPILDYLDKHPEALVQPAGPTVVEALSAADGTCR
ncbi:Rap1a/Tai family immunity protein [Methylomagnum ishizawai]|uniref:Rap1a/Tai family immunity protein n=1 Tax=Methylomagnum ishizawai TaxID=1760988 RepID=UPI001C329D90|nr:Rap1a/Tai family immunity protein [Methylomagnum ishizawai]BBL73806.1 hypothetical protein MishRS11D_09040 [Methylomagnum ishizawai]